MEAQEQASPHDSLSVSSCPRQAACHLEGHSGSSRHHRRCASASSVQGTVGQCAGKQGTRSIFGASHGSIGKQIFTPLLSCITYTQS